MARRWRPGTRLPVVWEADGWWVVVLMAVAVLLMVSGLQCRVACAVTSSSDAGDAR